MQCLPHIGRSNSAVSLRLILNRKTKKIKSVTAELNMSQSLIRKFNEEVEKIEKELLNAKRKYFEQRRMDRLGDLALAARTLNSV